MVYAASMGIQVRLNRSMKLATSVRHRLRLGNGAWYFILASLSLVLGAGWWLAYLQRVYVLGLIYRPHAFADCRFFCGSCVNFDQPELD